MMLALILLLLCVACLLLVAAEEQESWLRTLQAVERDVSTDSLSSKLKAKLAERMRKQEMVTALGISQEVAAMNYDIRWGNEWFKMNDEKRKGTNIYVFGAFWDVRARQFNLRYGYWTQSYETYLNQSARAEMEKKQKRNKTSTKLNMNPYNQTLAAEIKHMYYNLDSQGYSQEDIKSMLRGNFSAAVARDQTQRLDQNEKEKTSMNEISSQVGGSASAIVLGTPNWSSSTSTTKALWDPSSTRPKNRGGSSLSVEEAKKQGLSEIQMKKWFKNADMNRRKRDAMNNTHVNVDSGSSSSIGVRRLEGKPSPSGTKPRLSKLPTGIGDALYVRVYMVAHKKLIGPGTLREGFIDYRVGSCEFHYRSGKITQGKYYLQVQSRELNKPGKMLAAAYAVCHLDDFTGGEYPEGVALNPLNYKGEKQIMMIRGNRRVVQNLGTRNAKQKKFLAVCVRPIYKAYRDYQQLANFLLYYSHVGVSHFVIYNSGVASPRLMGLLDIARRANVSLELRNWNIQDDLAYENMQNMNIEVCVHSLMGFYKYVAVVDLDELIVPMKYYNLPAMIQSITKDTPKMIDKPHAFIFKTAFFCRTNSPRITFPDYKSNGDKLMILRDTVRTDVIQRVRYKYIVRPESLYESSVHFPYVSPRVMMRQLTNPVLYVNASDALVHHYRDIELSMDDVMEAKNCSTVDNRMFRYANDLKSSQLYKLLASEGYWQPAERQTEIQESSRDSFDASLQGAAHIIVAYDKKLYFEKKRKERQQAEMKQSLDARPSKEVHKL